MRMQKKEARRGIEWKILRSIFLVGTLPLTLALVVGYIAAHQGQGNSAEQTLRIAAQGKAEAVQLAASFYIRIIKEVASAPVIVSSLTPDTSGAIPLAYDAETQRAVENRLLRADANDDSQFSEWAIYDPTGRRLYSTNDIGFSRETSLSWNDLPDQPTFVDLFYHVGAQTYVACLLAPVTAPGRDRPVGYMAEVFDLDTLLRYALGDGPGSSREVQREIHYQILFESGAEIQAVAFDFASVAEAPRMRIEKPDEVLAQKLWNSGAPASGSMRLSRYPMAEGPQSIFLAYHRMFQDEKGYIVAYRTSWSVFRNVNLGALIAIAVCVVFIAFLCLNAYRNVHNNIVRPVLLLNEGAQIIGQGDLELKLKIGTGDEIEELAHSFNKMALALKRNIRQLGESEGKYRSLVTSMRDGIFQTDPQGLIGFINPAGVEILGCGQPESVLGQALGNMFLEADEMQPILSELRKEGFVERSRVWMKRQDGRAICVELSANLMHDDMGDVVGIEGIFRDVTKNVRLEREARDRAERLSAINQIANVINSSLEAGRLYESLVVEVKKLVDFDYASLALLDEDHDAFVTRQLWPEREHGAGVSRAIDDETSCAAWVAKQRQCLVVDDLSALSTPFAGEFPPGTRSCVSAPLYATGRIIGTLNLGLAHPNGFTHHDVEVLEQMAPHVAVAIRNAHLLDNLQKSLDEVTRAREKLHEANEELKTLDEMKTNLLSNVSHELRTPLVSIMGYTDMIHNGKVGPINNTQREYLAISLRNVEKLVTLIENLLDFSRLHRGAETLVFDAFDIVDCARSSIQIMQPVADSREIALILEAPDKPVMVEGDKGKLGQVFNNLLSNAVKFNHNGGAVTIRIHPTEDSVECAVIDTGIGIPQEALDKIFTRFYQYDSSSTRKYGGTGIGLSITQDIVRLHGSRVTVSSEVGKGSTFRFTLARMVPRREGSGAAHPDAALPAETHLLIELLTQDRALSNQIRALLVPEGMDVIHAVSAAHAVSLLGKHRPDCLLVDMGSFGEETAALDELLAQMPRPGIPVIIATNDDRLYEQYRASVAARIKRSFRKSSLLSGIHYALSKDLFTNGELGNGILCVEDDPEILLFIRRCLEAEGYTVDEATSGEEGLRMAARRDFSVVLLDVAMPGMDGWEACRLLKSDPTLRGIKVYMVTAKPMDSKHARSPEAQPDGFLLKPFHPEDLLELIRSIDAIQPIQEA